MSITLSIPPEIVQEVREWAEEQGTSLNPDQLYRGMAIVNPFTED
jgi:hypothetical protein